MGKGEERVNSFLFIFIQARSRVEERVEVILTGVIGTGGSSASRNKQSASAASGLEGGNSDRARYSAPGSQPATPHITSPGGGVLLSESEFDLMFRCIYGLIWGSIERLPLNRPNLISSQAKVSLD